MFRLRFHSWDPEELSQAHAFEARMQAQDDAIHAVRNARNALEAFVLSTRGARDGNHGSLIKASETSELLDAAEDWLYSDEAESALDATVYTSYQEKLEAQLHELNQEYYAALEVEAEERAKREAEDRARWEAEAASQSEWEPYEPMADSSDGLLGT